MKLFNWFYNLKTAAKLLIAFLIIAAIQMGVGFFALSNLGKLNTSIGEMHNGSIKPLDYLTQSRGDLLEIRERWQNTRLNIDRVDSSEQVLKEVNESRKAIEQNIELYGKGSLANEQAELLSNFLPAWHSYTEAYDESIRSMVSGKNLGDLDQKAEELNFKMYEVDTIIDQLIAADISQAEKTSKDAQSLYSTSALILIISIVFTFILSILFGIFISRMISKPLNQVVGLVEKVADGDLTETADIYTKDEVGALAQAINTMVLKLRATVQNILSAAENLSASSEQVSASTEEIASASLNQANAAQTMNELFRELSEAINSVAQNTEQAAELANKTIQIAQAGEQVVISSVEGANVVNEQISNLEKDSNKIGEIIEVIDDIADQTNLLALNAAIEAARAGDQGRGFAVVADEVRKLAERSSEATKQITDIIKGMQQNTALSVKSVREGRAFTEQSGVAFENIINMVNDTGNKVTEIAGASEEQAAQSAEVLTFIESISAATEETTASSEETVSAAHSLTDLAEELNASVAAFKIHS